jgi:pSer/pThr/pTyr-binding forkhead associated (FHA) protein
MPRFTLLRQGRIERSVALPSDDIVFGRLSGTGVELPSPTVSRHHARVRRDGEHWVLEDLGSANGLWVGDRQVRRHELEPGDTFRIEEYAVLFEPSDDVYQSGLRASRETTLPGGTAPMALLSVGAFAAPSA